jgi:GT2 family glycosyltransferase
MIRSKLGYYYRRVIYGGVLLGYINTITIQMSESLQPVTIIIPFKDKVEVLKVCVESILSKTKYKNYFLLLINNQSVEKETFVYLDLIKHSNKIKILNYDNPFNYSAIHNWAMSFVNSEFVLFLNNDTEVIDPEWLNALVGNIEKDNVGAVGALLLYPDGRIQHAGVGLFLPTLFHIHEGEIPNGKFMSEINSSHELYAVTGACLMTKKSLYEKVGGMDSVNFTIGLNDIDYCLKLKQANYKVIYNPKAKLYHYESYSRGKDWLNFNKFKRAQKEGKFFIQKWNQFYLSEMNSFKD